MASMVRTTARDRPVHCAPVTSGWFPDPTGRFEYRYYNGRTWTGDVSTGGERYVDPGTPGAPAPTTHERGRNPAATAALVCGIVSLTICWLPVLFVGGFVIGATAVVLGTLGIRRARVRGGAGRGFAVAGLSTGAVGVVGSVGGLLLTIVAFDAIDRYEDPGPNTAAITECSVEAGHLRVAGTVRNDGTETADYTVVYEVRRADTDDVVLRAREPLHDVAPGASAPFGAGDRTTVDEVECSVEEVTGPLPFGVAP